jgi:soluble lytic murein transglycosylase-like protein
MINHDISTVHPTVRPFALAREVVATARRDLGRGLRIAAHHALLATGVCAILALGFIFVNPDLADRLKRLSPFYAESTEETERHLAALLEPPGLDSTASQPVNAEYAAELAAFAGDAAQQQRVTAWLSKRYRVAKDATNMLVSAAYLTAREVKIDPLLILAVMGIESRFNPFAESPVGAQGLMQVMAKVHSDKFEDHGGVQAALNPVANIKVGSLILKEYVRRGGSVEAGLKMYVGAANMENDAGYGAKVLAEYHRLQEVAMGKAVPAHTTPKRPETATAEPETVLNKEAAVMDQPA